jgi:hypothetical protein
MRNNMLSRLNPQKLKYRVAWTRKIQQIEEDTDPHARVFLSNENRTHILMTFLEPFFILNYDCCRSQTCVDFVSRASIDTECVTRDRR